MTADRDQGVHGRSYANYPWGDRRPIYVCEIGVAINTLDTMIVATGKFKNASPNTGSRCRSGRNGCCLRRLYLLALATLVFTPQAHAWWNTSWNKLRPVDITWSGATQTNFQVKVDVTYDVDMQADFDDIRFVDSDDLTPLDYWRCIRRPPTEGIIVTFTFILNFIHPCESRIC